MPKIAGIGISRPPRPRLPASVRNSLARRMDWMLACILAASLLLHFGFVVYLHGLDVPSATDVEALPDHFARVIVPQPIRVEPEPPAHLEDDSAARPRKQVRPRPAGQRPAPDREQVLHTGVLKILTSRGGGLVDDVLRNGDVSSDADRVFDQIGGVEVGGDVRGLGARDGGAAHGLRIGGDLRAHGPAAVRSGERSDERTVRGDVTGSAPIDVEGGNPAAIARSMRGRFGAIKACYQSALKRNPLLGGKLQLRFEISAIGKVTSLSIEKDTLHDDELGRCVTSKMATWRFPNLLREAVLFSFALVFQPAR